jgi:DNA mismatch repair ATPase MutL
MQFFFLNNRFIKTRTGLVALEEAYKNQIMAGKFPACVLNIQANAQSVDVNVHPAKTEVRFANEKLIFNAVYYCAKSALTEGDSRVQANIQQKQKQFVQKQYMPQPVSGQQIKIYEQQLEKVSKDDFWQKTTADEFKASVPEKKPVNPVSTKHVLRDDSVFRVTGCAAFGSHENSYRLCGTKGQAENLRDRSERVMVNYNDWEIPEGAQESSIYMPEWNDPDEALIEQTGHGGSDFIVVREFFDCIRENKHPILDVYCATTMASVGILAHRSLLERGVPYDIPDFRKEEDRVKYENDTLTPFYGSDGSEPTLPCCSHPDYIPSEEVVKRYLEIIGE